MTEASESDVLVIGRFDSGKSTFRTQLALRLEHKPGALALSESIQDTTPLRADMDLISQGRQPEHTQAQTYNTVTLNMVDKSNRRIRLDFPDYGGEQVSKIADSNIVDSRWAGFTSRADAWIYLLRIDAFQPAKSMFTDPVQARPDSHEKGEISDQLSIELATIETIQRLLFLRRISLRYRTELPLAVLLSCWDELSAAEQATTPSELLRARAPLLSSFLTTNWAAGRIRVWGLSSTEKALARDKDLEFARIGAENIGFIIDDTMNRSKDLTTPLSWLLDVNNAR